MIIQFVVKTLVGMLDWNLNPQQAVSMIDFGTANTPTSNVGGEHPLVNTANDGADDPLVKGLRERGEQVSVDDQSSGLSALQRSGNGWVGGADPRREGAVMGDDASLKCGRRRRDANDPQPSAPESRVSRAARPRG